LNGARLTLQTGSSFRPRSAFSIGGYESREAFIGVRDPFLCGHFAAYLEVAQAYDAVQTGVIFTAETVGLLAASRVTAARTIRHCRESVSGQGAAGVAESRS
jgi:hypothetical protein